MSDFGFQFIGLNQHSVNDPMSKDELFALGCEHLQVHGLITIIYRGFPKANVWCSEKSEHSNVHQAY